MIGVIQLDKPIDLPLKQQIQAAGAEVLRIVGDSRVIVSTSNANNVLEVRGVNSIKRYLPSIDLEKRQLEYLTEGSDDETASPSFVESRELVEAHHRNTAVENKGSLLGLLIAIFFTTEYRDTAAENLRRLNIDVVEEPGENMLVIDLINHPDERAAFWTIFNETGLRSIEEDSIPEVSNNSKTCPVSVVKMGKPTPESKPEFLWTGKGEIIAIADTGIDTGIMNTLHEDLRQRVMSIESYPIQQRYRNRVDNAGEDMGAADIYSGHGTHVAGCAVGSGENSEGQLIGTAPDAQLVFQSLEQKPKWCDLELQRRIDRGEAQPSKPDNLSGIPTDLQTLFKSAYEKGARIHSNSWGSNKDKRLLGKYLREAESVDTFMWRNKDFLVVMSAGNEGYHFDVNNRWVDANDIITSPGTSKNCLTVGACESDRSSESELSPNLGITYGTRYHVEPPKFSRFLHEPFHQDPMADSYDDIAAFSGRGYCDRGQRYKPDVVAPGTFILSTRSSLIPADEVGSAHHCEKYLYMCGTSMATPLVAGGAALVRQYLREQEGIDNPSAALIKAIIIHSARYLNYRYKNRSPSNPSQPWVDNEQGWGRVTLIDSLKPQKATSEDPTQMMFEDLYAAGLPGLVEGEECEYQVKVEYNTVPLKIIMAYTDYPWERDSEREQLGDSKLVNNLNLIAYSPTGKYYIGNYFGEQDRFDEKWLDKTNNVEGIMVDAPEIGTWKIKVVATKVVSFIQTGERQDFALVASGGGLKRENPT